MICFFTGDSGYGQQPWLFTPIGDAQVQTQKEEHYNRVHRKAQHNVEMHWSHQKSFQMPLSDAWPYVRSKNGWPHYQRMHRFAQHHDPRKVSSTR